MKTFYRQQLLLICAASLLLQICSIGARAQQQQPPPPPLSQTQSQPPEPQQEQTDDVVRVRTELVQTDVTVLDKQGKFVDGLKKEDFELKVDGKPVEVSFFERIAAGTASEEAQLASARGRPRAKANQTEVAKPLDRGRIVAFFIDDLHISFESLKYAKDAITKYIDKEMRQNDLVVITSASGQIGFLQQYTNNKEVLKAALARVSYRNNEVRDMERPPMSVYHALLIDRGEPIIDFFIEETIKLNPGIGAQTAMAIVKGRANTILQQTARASRVTLQTLEGLARLSAGLPGRKLVFLISDGLYLDARNGNMIERIRNITDASARSGVVIYSIDAKGLSTGLPDAGSDVPFDPSGRIQQSMSAELTASQDVINALAVDTGGRLIHNTNAIDASVTSAIKETSLYYLLAWRPDGEAGRNKKFRRIEVGVRNRPELSVRLQRGYYDSAPEVKPKEKESATAKAKAPADPLRKAINSLFPQQELPTHLALSYMDTAADGSTLVASMKVESEALKFQPRDGRTATVVDIAGTIFDSRGSSFGGFRERLTITPGAASTSEKLPDIIYNYRATLKPGLYQVRVAAHDNTSGQTGSAVEWVEIPDLSKQRLSLSSLIVGKRSPEAEEEKKAESLVEGVALSIDHSFERSSNLRFLIYIYNAARGATTGAHPDVALQVQIFRDDQPVVTTPLRKVSTEAQDLARLAYAAEIPLQEMSSGQYILQVTAIDRIAKTSASQRFRFEVQ